MYKYCVSMKGITVVMNVSKDIAVKRLLERDKILLISHMSPDGDTLGCSFALYNALSSLGKNVRIACSDAVPKRFEYLTEGYVEKDFEPDFIVTLDVAALQLFGDATSCYREKVDLCIDHHPSNELFAKETYLVTTAGAACEIVYGVIADMGVELTSQIARCLYTGIATDTGCFKYSNTTSETHRIAGELYKLDVNYEEINTRLFNTKSKSRIAIEQQVLNSIEYYYDDRVAVVCVTQDMIEQSGADESEFDDISSIPRSIEGVEIGVTLKEKPDGSCKISIRTNHLVDASKLCSIFGGGGHKRAAGCLIKGGHKFAKIKVLEEISSVLS